MTHEVANTSIAEDMERVNRQIARRQKISSLIRYVLLIVVGFVMLYPLIWLIGASFKTNSEIFSNPGFWPKEPTDQRLCERLANVDPLHFRAFLLEYLPDHFYPRPSGPASARLSWLMALPASSFRSSACSFPCSSQRCCCQT